MQGFLLRFTFCLKIAKDVLCLRYGWSLCWLKRRGPKTRTDSSRWLPDGGRQGNRRSGSRTVAARDAGRSAGTRAESTTPWAEASPCCWCASKPVKTIPNFDNHSDSKQKVQLKRHLIWPPISPLVFCSLKFCKVNRHEIVGTCHRSICAITPSGLESTPAEIASSATNKTRQGNSAHSSTVNKGACFSA